MNEKFVSDRITELRINANISEYQLSLELGHSKSYIQSISSGRTCPSMPAFFDICNYFDITPQEFFDEELKETDLIHEIISKLKTLNHDDLEFFNMALDKYLNKT